MKRFFAVLWIVFSQVAFAQQESAGDGELFGNFTLQSVHQDPSANSSSIMAAQLSGAYLFRPWEGENIHFGPKLGAMSTLDGSTRFDFYPGMQLILWSMNAIGLSFESQLAFPSKHRGQGTSAHVQLNPGLYFRVAHFQNSGAWALIVGPIYDTRFKWGVQAGISLQPWGAD